MAEIHDISLALCMTVTGWRICIDYRKLNESTRKDHYPVPFIDQMSERLAGKEYYCFLDNYSRYNQIVIALEDQEKTTFTCPYDTYAFKRMSFGLCNSPTTFQRCMMAIFMIWLKILWRYSWMISQCLGSLLTGGWRIWTGC
uniref:Reverse transcriptase domain-containing protein n=1 Tax=Solanum lycopersicum TaxID=4081 RepID=A0A3Q7HKJ5_SOLLC